LAALLISGQFPASYYTDGEPTSADVRIATQIAQEFGLPHRVHSKTVTEVTSGWESAWRRLVQQSDGMVSLWQAADALEDAADPERPRIKLWGICVAGKDLLGSPKFYLLGCNLETVQRYLVQESVKDSVGLVRGEAIELAKSCLERFAAEVVDEGFPVLDVPELFDGFEDVRRWGGTNARKAAPVCDLFVPMCTRPFAEAALSLSAPQRYTQPLHQGLIQLLVPELHGIPLDQDPWPSPRPAANVVRWAAGWPMRRIRSRLARQRSQEAEQIQPFDQASWLEVLRPSIRQVCLDQSDSELWRFVDRSEFERLTSPLSDPSERRRYVYLLLNVATLFHYAATLP
jgi:hypothetical protein